jgi:hypothetical protein
VNHTKSLVSIFIAIGFLTAPLTLFASKPALLEASDFSWWISDDEIAQMTKDEKRKKLRELSALLNTCEGVALNKPSLQFKEMVANTSYDFYEKSQHIPMAIFSGAFGGIYGAWLYFENKVEIFNARSELELLAQFSDKIAQTLSD